MSPSNPKWTLKLFNLTEKLMSTKPKTFLKTKPKLFNQTKTSSSTKNQTFSTKLTDQANKSPNFVQLHQTNKSPNGINTRTVSSSFRRAKKLGIIKSKSFGCGRERNGDQKLETVRKPRWSARLDAWRRENMQSKLTYLFASSLWVRTIFGDSESQVGGVWKELFVGANWIKVLWGCLWEV